MGARQKAWARNQTELLRQKLGGKCAICGTSEKLQFDCIVPMGHKHHRIEYSARLSFYRGQYANGNLQLLCERHNSLKGAAELELEDELPF
jgi:5-methylcytosine-specific restriction endonuclease McrA